MGCKLCLFYYKSEVFLELLKIKEYIFLMYSVITPLSNLKKDVLFILHHIYYNFKFLYPNYKCVTNYFLKCMPTSNITTLTCFKILIENQSKKFEDAILVPLCKFLFLYYLCHQVLLISC